jgi:hypothetical protein
METIIYFEDILSFMGLEKNVADDGLVETKELDVFIDRHLLAEGYSLRSMKVRYELFMSGVEKRCEPLYGLLTKLGLPKHSYETELIPVRNY